jgi:hypothetical protein
MSAISEKEVSMSAPSIGSSPKNPTEQNTAAVASAALEEGSASIDNCAICLMPPNRILPYHTGVKTPGITACWERNFTHPACLQQILAQNNPKCPCCRVPLAAPEPATEALRTMARIRASERSANVFTRTLYGPEFIQDLVQTYGFKYAFSTVLRMTGRRENMDLVQMVIALGPNDEDRGEAVLEAVREDLPRPFNALLADGAQIPEYYRVKAAKAAAWRQGNPEMLNRLLTLFPPGQESEYHRSAVLRAAIRGGHLENVNAVIATGLSRGVLQRAAVYALANLRISIALRLQTAAAEAN